MTSQGLSYWETLPASSLSFQFTGISQTLETRDFTFLAKRHPICVGGLRTGRVIGLHIL